MPKNLYQYDDAVALKFVGAKQSDVKKSLEAIQPALDQFVHEIGEGVFPAFSSAFYDHDLVGLQALAENWRQRYSHFVVLGVGGSSLGAQMLVNLKGRFVEHHPKLYFVDNVDPDSVDTLLKDLPLNQTGVLCVSKSGGTVETLSQTLLFIESFKQSGLEISSHMYALVEEGENPLRILMEHYGVAILNHPKNIGGRFSVLSLVGLLPALFANVDVFSIRNGAEAVLDKFLRNPLKSEPSKGGALSFLAAKNGMNMHVMMPYSDRLRVFSDWFVQLWAESLGKSPLATTPIPMVGSTDQHSSLQLLSGGPADKLLTMIIPNCTNEGCVIQSEEDIKRMGQDVLHSLSMGTLIYHQAQGTMDALVAQKRPVRVFHTEKLDEEILGALIMHFMLETVVTSMLLEVNPWDQPGVEDSKKRTKEYLTKPSH